jgi:hypothetical protein
MQIEEMNKQDILSEIRRITKENGGKAPGALQFAAKTGIRKSDWFPTMWLKWSDAIADAGCQPNEFITAYDSDILITKYIELIRELGHFPVEGELRLKKINDNKFPSDKAFYQLGSKRERAQRIIDYCSGKKEYIDIIPYCSEIAGSIKNYDFAKTSAVKSGFVYIIRHGKRNEYKIGKTFNPIRREGEIRLELPEKVQPIHFIETDDPTGIEIYWHTRFASKRKEGEWFALSSEDVRAFKRWRKIY